LTVERRAEPVTLSQEGAEHIIGQHAECLSTFRIDTCLCNATLALWCGHHGRYLVLFARSMPCCEHAQTMVALVADDGEIEA
jgi:hypothetical protein